jgi:hypothetical protein
VKRRAQFHRLRQAFDNLRDALHCAEVKLGRPRSDLRAESDLFEREPEAVLAEMSKRLRERISHL